MRIRIAIALIGLVAVARVVAQTPAPQTPAGTARVSGQVTSAGTGRPLRAIVEILPTSGGIPRRVRADALGKFELASLPAGTYRLTASADGFVSLQYGQGRPPEPYRPIDLKDGEQFNKADFALPKTSAVEGRLVDEFGDPAPNVEVQVARVQYIAGKSRLFPASTPRTTRPTDDQGHFRVYGLPPGDYYLMALSGPFATNPTWAGFAPTFYPGTTSAPEARAIHLEPGQDATNLSFALAPAQSATMSGRAVDASGQPLRTGIVLFQLYGGDVRAVITGRSTAGPDGTFLFRNVPFGTYAIQSGTNASNFGSLVVTVDRPVVSELTLSITGGATLRGKITWEGDAPKPAADTIRIGSTPMDFVNGPMVGGGGPPSKVNDDGTFEVSKLFGAGVVRVDLRGAPYVIKSVTVDGKDVTDTPIDFTKGDVRGVEILLTSKIATISGAVTDGDRTVTECAVLVFTEDPTKWTFPSRFIAMARPNQQGRFTITTLPPGTYRAVALGTLQGPEVTDPTFLERMRGLGVQVTIAEGETKTIDLKLQR